MGRAVLAELPTAEVVKVPDGGNAGQGVAHQRNVAGEGGVRAYKRREQAKVRRCFYSYRMIFSGLFLCLLITMNQ